MNHSFSTNISRLLSDSYRAKVSSTKKHSYDTTNLDLSYATNIGRNEISANYYRSFGNTEYDSFGSNLNQNHRDNHLKLNVNYMFAYSHLDLFYIKKTNENYTEVDWYGHFKALKKNKEETVNMFQFNYNLICDNMEKQYSDLNSNS